MTQLPVDFPRVRIQQIDEYKSKLNSVIAETENVNAILEDVKDIADLVSNASNALSIAIGPLGGTPFVQAMAQFSAVIATMSTGLNAFTSTVAEATTFDLNRIGFADDIVNTITGEKLDVIAQFQEFIGPLDQTILALNTLNTPLDTQTVLTALVDNPNYVSELINQRQRAIDVLQEKALEIANNNT